MFKIIGGHLRFILIAVLISIGIAIIVFRPEDHTGGPTPGTSYDLEQVG